MSLLFHGKPVVWDKLRKPRVRMIAKDASWLKLVTKPVPAHFRYFKFFGLVVGETSTHYLVAYYGPVTVNMTVTASAFVRLSGVMVNVQTVAGRQHVSKAVTE